MDSYWPESTLADLLDIQLQNYEIDYRKYWHLDSPSCPPEVEEADWKLARLLDAVGSKLVSSARALRLQPDLEQLLREERPWQGADEAATELLRYEIAQHRAEIDLATDAVGRLFTGKRRLLLLQVLLSPHALSERALAYVNRMTHCFVWSFDTEFAIMSRSVVEAALEERLSEEAMRELGYKSGAHGFAFWQYEKAAAQTGVLGLEALEAVRAVRRSGNDAVHAAPGLEPDPTKTLVDVITILRQLYPAR